MATPRTKSNVGLTLVILFIAVLATGIVVHMKKHGIVLDPNKVIKSIHWPLGFLMVAFACVHGVQFRKALAGMKKRFKWFFADTWVVIIFVALTFITGAVKLLSPIKIHNLGLVHYWCGMLLSAAIILHLIRGIPAWKRLRKACKGGTR